MSAPARSWREKARLSIYDRVDVAAAKVCGIFCSSTNMGCSSGVLGIDDEHRPVVQDQPFLLVSHHHDRMFGLVPVVAYDHKSEIGFGHS